MPTKAEQRRALYRHRVLHKMCTRCAQPPAGNHRECRECIEKRRALGPYYRDYRRKRRAALLAAGCCPQHHKRPVVAGMTGCRQCVERGRSLHSRQQHRQRRARNVANGVCVNHPRREAAPNAVSCPGCLEASRARGRAAIERRAAMNKSRGRGARPIPASLLRRGYRPSPTRKQPIGGPAEVSQPRVLAVSESVAAVLRLMLSESRDLATADPAEIADRCTGAEPAFLSEVSALRDMYIRQWGRRAKRVEE